MSELTLSAEESPHGTKLTLGDLWTFLSNTQAEAALAACANGVAMARRVYEPRWQTVVGHNLTEDEFHRLLTQIVFTALYPYALNDHPLVVTDADVTHPYAWRHVRVAVARSFGLSLATDSAEACALASQLLGMSLARYADWLRYEAQMDETR